MRNQTTPWLIPTFLNLKIKSSNYDSKYLTSRAVLEYVRASGIFKSMSDDNQAEIEMLENNIETETIAMLTHLENTIKRPPFDYFSQIQTKLNSNLRWIEKINNYLMNSLYKFFSSELANWLRKISYIENQGMDNLEGILDKKFVIWSVIAQDANVVAKLEDEFRQRCSALKEIKLAQSNMQLVYQEFGIVKQEIWNLKEKISDLEDENKRLWNKAIVVENMNYKKAIDRIRNSIQQMIDKYQFN